MFQCIDMLLGYFGGFPQVEWWCLIGVFSQLNYFLQLLYPETEEFSCLGLLSVHVPSLILLSPVSFIRCAPESFLAYRLIVEIPVASLSSFDEAMVDIWSNCNKSANFFRFLFWISFHFTCVHFGPTSTGELKVQHWLELLVAVQDYILRDAARFSRDSVNALLPMCHSTHRHRLSQATLNTLGLGISLLVYHYFLPI
jgi:hypothetical protein